MQNTNQMDPQPLLAQVRDTFADFQFISSRAAQDQPQAKVVGSVSQQDFLNTMSKSLAETVRNYNASSPDGDIVLLRYTADDTGTLRAMLDSGRQAPSQDKIVQFTTTNSVADAGQVRVQTELLTAAHPSAFNDTPTQSTPPKGGNSSDFPSPRNPDQASDM